MFNQIRAMIVASIKTRYLNQLLASPEGLAFFLGYLASIERDEVHLFEELLSRVPDERFQKMIRIHREDEQRHSELLNRCAMSVGPKPIAAPVELNMPYRLEQALCGLTESFLQGSCGVFEVYALLQVLEERAVREYPAFIKALEAVDTESAEILRQILEDEKRHVGYARAIARQYAPSAAAHDRTLACYRAVEAQAFEQQGREFALFMLDRGLLQLGALEATILRAMCTMAPTPKAQRSASTSSQRWVELPADGTAV
jgi:rubrerythrin